MNKEFKANTPSEFYRNNRPEFFSDSNSLYEVELPKETLAYALNQISTDQKHDEFESLCRKLAETFIAPNLIPQVGPTGGGDGKTDSETYPVSNDIADRWFVPENGWNKDEKWAFAFSSKKDWKSKAKKDIEKIVGTGRGYTRAYFISNQKISSKRKKDTQDEFIEKFKIDVVILDGEWILEKIYTSNLIDLAVDSLNLSDSFKRKSIILGRNDAERKKKLEEIEEKIINPNRYSEFDFQIVEDALEAAILSRMLEKPRDEVEGKFERALRMCKKVNNTKQWVRIYYQRAWTYIHWYNDFALFVSDFKNFKNFINHESSIYEVELYFNLMNLLKGLHINNDCNLSELHLDLSIETDEFIELLERVANNESKPSSALIAKTYKSLFQLGNVIVNQKNPSEYISAIIDQFIESQKYLEYPFERFHELIEIFSAAFPNNSDFDNLIDTIASISEKRTSELVAGEIFLKRGARKLNSKYYKDSIFYFGKAVMKLAKEESKNGFYLSLLALSKAYSSLGLMWASNCCLVAATRISIKSWYEKGIIDERSYDCTKDLIINELFIGRVTCMLGWLELNQLISTQVDIIVDEPEDIPFFSLVDGCLSVRLMNTHYRNYESATYLPDLFEKYSLWVSQDVCLYQLGQTEKLLENYKERNVKDEGEFDQYFERVANQPFKEQMVYETDFFSDEVIQLKSTILGTKFEIHFKTDKELLIAAETILAYFESLLATSLTKVYPSSEFIKIELKKNEDLKSIKFVNNGASYEYIVEFNNFDFANELMGEIMESMMAFAADLISRNFVFENINEHLEKLFKEEEVSERLSLILEHRNFMVSILGNDPKIFFNDWVDKKTAHAFEMKRQTPIEIISDMEEIEVVKSDMPIDLNRLSHNKRKVFSITDLTLWNEAKWQGFGSFTDSLNYSNSSTFGIFLAFENEGVGKQIFENWIKKLGKEDISEEIKITIIKGVDKNNPHWYRVNISRNLDSKSFPSGQIFTLPSRHHEFQPSNSNNLDNLIDGYNFIKQYSLCPAKLIDGNKIVPYYDLAIRKRSLFIKNAWELDEHDLDSVVIKENDEPFIPSGVIGAPVLKVIAKRKSI